MASLLMLPMQHQMTIFSLGLETFLASYGLDDEAVEIHPEALVIRSAGGGLSKDSAS